MDSIENVKAKIQDKEGSRPTSSASSSRGSSSRTGGRSPTTTSRRSRRSPGARLRGGLNIKVKTLTGKELEIDIEIEDSIARIKERVAEKEGIPPPQQRLIFGGKQMADDKSAGHYNVEGGSVLHLVLALRGGGGL